ncbi:MAG: ATP-binding protein [Firmicutes bacterium]|nr:ATP-binding protein [Bacillota bacterium]
MNSNDFCKPMHDIFLNGANKNLKQFEDIILSCKKSNDFNINSINEAFRIIHTIKGLSSMIPYDSIVSLSHSMEDLFYRMREKELENIDYNLIFNLIFECVDFIRAELRKIASNEDLNGEPSTLIDAVNSFLSGIKADEKLYCEMGSKVCSPLTENKSLCQKIKMRDADIPICTIPILASFDNLHRMMCDMCEKLGKKAELAIIGGEIEVDKITAECIFCSLVHILCNAIDHGIESPVRRKAIGKHPTGQIKIQAEMSDNWVFITVNDDGRGLCKKELLRRANENSLIRKPVQRLMESEIYNFILLPGFSTSKKVTRFSGRGMGLDVVAKNLERIGGTVLIDSVENEGMTVSLKIPSML